MSQQLSFKNDTMATNVDRKLLTIVFLSGTDHSVKVSSNFESVCAGALLEFFGGFGELMLSCYQHIALYVTNFP